MSYAFAPGLQAAVYQRLVADSGLTALVGQAIYDAPPAISGDEIAPDHVLLGEETVRAYDTKTSRGAQHDFSVTVHSGREGFDVAKRIAAAVCASLVDAELSLSEGHLVALRLLQAKAERGPAPEKRRIALRFRAVVDQDI